MKPTLAIFLLAAAAAAQAQGGAVAALHKEHLEAANKSVLGPLHTDLNETYFGLRSTGAPLVAPGPRSPQPQPGVSSPGAAPQSGTQLPASPK
jgi:hypothetical protein